MNHTIQDALTAGTRALSLITDTPALEAALLLAHALKKTREYLYAHPEVLLTDPEWQLFQAYLARRVAREPLAYITGMREFWSLPLQVTPATLIPRPETEVLVETVLRLLPLNKPCHVADLGTGSGAIAIALASERSTWQIHAVDISAESIDVAKKNASLLGFSNISFYGGNWSTVLSELGAKRLLFDMIVSNPPYLSQAEWQRDTQGLHYEPAHALTAAEEGLGALREVIQLARTHLVTDGYLVLEHGATQGPAVRALLIAAEFTAITTIKDLAGLERVSYAKR